MAKQLQRKFPFVHRGMIVYWYPDGNREHPPSPALVTAINEQGINLKTFEDFSDRSTHRECVRHLDDDSATQTHYDEAGGWAHTESTNVIAQLYPDFLEWPGQKPVKEKK